MSLILNVRLQSLVEAEHVLALLIESRQLRKSVFRIDCSTSFSSSTFLASVQITYATVLHSSEMCGKVVDLIK